MTTLAIDASVLEKLRSCGTVVEVLDQAGKVAGYFVPKDDQSFIDSNGPKISEEEIERRIAEGGGRSLDEIVQDWMH